MDGNRADVRTKFVCDLDLPLCLLLFFFQAACKNDPESNDAKKAVDLMYETALISSGFSVRTTSCCVFFPPKYYTGYLMFV